MQVFGPRVEFDNSHKKKCLKFPLYVKNPSCHISCVTLNLASMVVQQQATSSKYKIMRKAQGLPPLAKKQRIEVDSEVEMEFGEMLVKVLVLVVGAPIN